MKNYYSNFEIEAIKKDLCFNYKDIRNKLNSLLKEYLSANEKKALTALKESLKESDYEEITPDFTSSRVSCYMINMEEGKIYKTEAYDFYFEYDNKARELYASSFTW